MKLRLQFLSILLCAFFTSFSQVQTINTAGMTFTPDTVTINLGDTIEFGPLGYHNAVEIDESTWIANDTTYNGGFYFSFGSPGGYFIADSAKTYYYICQPHASMGMKGVIIVNSVPTYGCTDSNATNFDPLATIDDGSCQYDSTCITFALFDVGGHLFVEHSGCMPNNFNTGAAQIDTTGMGGSGSYNFGWYDATGQLLDSSLTVSNLDTGSYILNIEDIGCAITLTHTFSVTYNYGCMDSTATNYDPLATCDDGCIYPLPPAENLFFSEYAEGSSNNKYFEIYNPTSDTVDLTNYAFARVNNNPTTVGVYEYWVDFDTAAVILPHDVYVVVHPSADSIIISQADMDYGSLSNGNDGFALVYGNEPSSPVSPASGGYIVLDWIGTWDGDYINNPGQSNDGWDVAGESIATANHTLIRKCLISQGDTSWSNAAGTNPVNSQWIVLANDDWSDIGQHIISPCNLIYGCIDSNACNYDSLATFDDGSCVYPGQTYQNNVTICSGQTYVIGINVYDSAGTYIDSLVSSIGCDSIVYTNLTIYSQLLISGGITDNTIGAGSYFSNSSQHLELSCYMSSELVSAVVYAENIVSQTFEIRDDNGNVLSDTTVTLIPGGHRIYFNYQMTPGMDYQLGVSGIPNSLFRNNAGVNYPYNFASAAAITSSSAGGSYYYFFYDIEVRQSSQPPTNYSICDGESITISGNVYDSTGNYVDTLVSSIGCDSLVFTNLVVYPSSSSTNNQTICSGETYSIGLNIYDSSGIYYDTLSTLYGCDSVVTTHLTVDSITGGMSVNQQVICIGDYIVVGNSIYDSPGMYLDTLSSANGCDSVVTTYLNVTTANYPSLNGGLADTSIYPGDFSNYNGYLILDANLLTLLKSATVYSDDTNSVTFELRNNAGFVIQSSTQMVYPGSQTLTFNFMIPPGTDYQLGIDGGNSGLFRNNAGNGNSISYPFNLGSINITSSNAGDQYYYFYYDIEIMPFGSYNPQMICEGDTIVVGNSIYNIPGIYIDTFTSVNSCDSLVYTNLQYYPTPSLNIGSMPSPAEICLGDTILLEASAGFSQYYWIYSNAIIGQNQNILLSPSEDTWYLLKAIDQYGCLVQEDIWVYVDTCFVGLDDPIIYNINIYPNPSFGIFNIEFNKVFDNHLNIRIVNSLGNVVVSEDLKAGERIKEFNLSEFSKGIYLIELQTEIGIYKKKIILQ